MKSSRNSDKPASLAEIAELAGVHKITVSRALRFPEKVKPSTRKKVLQIAKTLGYESNPVVSSVMSQMASGSKVGSIPIVFITDLGVEHHHHFASYLNLAVEKAKSVASLSGLSLSLIDFVKDDLSANRLKSILEYRNIKGVILNVGLSEKWKILRDAISDLPVVTLGAAIPETRCETVRADCHQMVNLAIEQLASKGFRRLGLCYYRGIDDYMQRQVDQLSTVRPSPLISTYKLPFYHLSDLKAWIEKNKIDAVISAGPAIYEKLLELGYEVPQQMGYAALGILPHRSVPGVPNDYIHMIHLAVFNLAHRIYSRGIDLSEYWGTITLVPGRWKDGENS